MLPRLVSEISPLDAFCDIVVGVGVGIGDSRSWITNVNAVRCQYKLIQTEVSKDIQMEKSNRRWRRKDCIIWRQ